MVTCPDLGHQATARLWPPAFQPLAGGHLFPSALLASGAAPTTAGCAVSGAAGSVVRTAAAGGAVPGCWAAEEAAGRSQVNIPPGWGGRTGLERWRAPWVEVGREWRGYVCEVMVRWIDVENCAFQVPSITDCPALSYVVTHLGPNLESLFVVTGMRG